MPAWPRNPLLYEINTRVWLNELSAKGGGNLTLASVPDEEIERIAARGFQAVWLMGVWTTGLGPTVIARTHHELQAEYRQALPDYTPDDCIGSPYAITTYQVSPTLGGPKALEAFREKLSRRGLRLMLDFVCNHFACDHRFVRERPEIFVQGNEDELKLNPPEFFKTPEGKIIAHGRDPYFAPWTDTAQINYACKAARETVEEKILSIAAQCDGVRCDMAMLILPEVFEKVWGGRLGSGALKSSFWNECIPRIRRFHPNFLFMAESYWNLEWRLQQEGFQFTYDKNLYDRLRTRDWNGVRQHLNAGMDFQSHCARFIENHDEPRAASAFGPAGARSAAVASFFAPGLKLFHEGQLEARRVKLPVQLGRRPLESEDAETALFYERILGVLSDPVFQDGTFAQCEVKSAGWNDASNESLIAFSWTPPRSSSRRTLCFLIVINMGDGRAYGRIPLPQSVFSSGTHYIFRDRYDGKHYEREAGELLWPGLYVALEAHEPHLFEVTLK